MKKHFFFAILLLSLASLLWSCDKEHTHTLSSHEAKAATCAEAGHAAYWECSDCEKYFSDAQGTAEITDIFSLTVSPLPHPFTWESNTASHWRSYTCSCTVAADTPAAHVFESNNCTVCGINNPDTSGSTEGDAASGLEFFLNADGQSYAVSGIGEARANIVVESTYKGLPVTTIKADAFKNSDLFTSITLPEGLTTIEEWAFYNCSTLKSLHLPSTIETIGEGAFGVLTELTTLTMSAEGENYVLQNGMLIDKRTQVLVLGVGNQIPTNGVTKIGDYAFSYRKNLSAITIPAGITEIGTNAFIGCTSLQSVSFSEGLVTIGGAAFAGCDLQSLALPNSLRTIKTFAFGSNRDLTHVTIPKYVTSIERGVLEGCTALQSLSIPFVGTSPTDSDGELTDILAEHPAFLQMDNLRTVTLTNTIHLPDYAFYGCEKLTNIHLPAGLLTIGSSAFGSCSALNEITIPAEVTEIGDLAFFGCDALNSVSFAVQNGWERISVVGRTDSLPVLSNPTDNATYLTDTYDSYTWKRS